MAMHIIRTSGSAMAPRTATAETMRERTRIVDVVGGRRVERLSEDGFEMARRTGRKNEEEAATGHV